MRRGVGGIGGVEIDDAAVDDIFTGHFDGGDAFAAPFVEPFQEILRIECFPDGEAEGGGFDFLGIGEGLEERGDAGDHDAGRFFAAQFASETESASEDRVAEEGAAREAFPGGEDAEGIFGEGAEVIREVIDIREAGKDDEEGAGSVASECGQGERGRRAPGSVDRGALSATEGGQDVVEALLPFDQWHQIGEMPYGGTLFCSHNPRIL
jgi:hypothetical protein